MGDVVPFRKIKSVANTRGSTLCKRGFHKWDVLKDQQFDVKQGKLVTVYQCVRCGLIKNEAR